MLKKGLICLSLLVGVLNAVPPAPVHQVGVFSKENSAVQEALSLFLRDLSGFADEDLSVIYAGLEFAAEKHQFQARKNKAQTPYIIHPIQVADNCVRIGQVRDRDTVVAALLHDTVEDTETTFEEIRSLFGVCVEGYVREVTDDKSLPKEERKRLQVVHAPHKSVGAAHIKLADKLANLSDLNRESIEGWPKEREAEYFAWAKQVTDGLPKVNVALKEAVDKQISAYFSQLE